MKNISIDFCDERGKIKPLNAVNNGPIVSRSDMSMGNFEEYKALKIPYARNHDAAYCASYGGEHTVDIQAVFPNFDADENDPANYDFHLTDELIKKTADAGTQTFYRLGSKIEHWSKKYGTLVPKDFNKWARICEHIIMHCNEGWADGHNWNIEYWEIWNEPDGMLDDSPHKPTWGGTKAEFFDFYTVAAKYLKNRFPHLKIGGPAMAFRYYDWLDEFLAHLSANNVPLDFYSWHVYNIRPEIFEELSLMIREKLDKAGYTNAESIINEWNYVHNWGSEFKQTLKRIKGMHGAAYTASVMCMCQYLPIDMLMYYDLRPCGFNGLFNEYYETLKTYPVFIFFSKLYELAGAVGCKNDEAVYTVAAKDADGNFGAMVTCYEDIGDDKTHSLTIELKNTDAKNVRVYLIDKEHDGNEIGVFALDNGKITLDYINHSVFYIEKA